MHSKNWSIVFLVALTILNSVGVRSQEDPDDYFGQDEVYDDDYYDDGAMEEDSILLNDDGFPDISQHSSSSTTAERLIQKIDVSHSNVTIIDNVDMESHIDARGSNIDIHGMTDLEDTDLENQTVINRPDLALNDLDKVIENGINELDINYKTPWIIEENPQDAARVVFHERMTSLQNGLDGVVNALKGIAGNLGCEDAGLCSAPFRKVKSGECLYMNVETRKTWPQAREHCQSLGADLAEPVTIRQDLEYIMRLSGTAMLRVGRDRLWVGASDTDEEGTWLWASGRVVAHDIGWTLDHPRDITGKEDCMAMIFTHPPGIEALSCFTRKPFVCQKHI